MQTDGWPASAAWCGDTCVAVVFQRVDTVRRRSVRFVVRLRHSFDAACRRSLRTAARRRRANSGSVDSASNAGESIGEFGSASSAASRLTDWTGVNRRLIANLVLRYCCPRCCLRERLPVASGCAQSLRVDLELANDYPARRIRASLPADQNWSDRATLIASNVLQPKAN